MKLPDPHDTAAKRWAPVIAFAVALGLAAVSVAVFGTGTRGIRYALDITARWSYPWFWVTYTGGALYALFGEHLSFVAGKNRRVFGLTFASAHSVHLMLVLWLYRISQEPPISTAGAVFFGIGIGFMYVMVLLSVKPVATMRPKLWHAFMFVGLEYIEYAFLTDFWVNPLHANTKQAIGYLPFALLGLFGTALRTAKGLRKLQPAMWQPQRH